MPETGDNTVILALIALISTCIGIVWKVTTLHTKLTEKVIEVVQGNTEATAQQAISNDKLGRAVERNTEVTIKQKDVLTKLALDSLQLNKRVDDNP